MDYEKKYLKYKKKYMALVGGNGDDKKSSQKSELKFEEITASFLEIANGAFECCENDIDNAIVSMAEHKEYLYGEGNKSSRIYRFFLRRGAQMEKDAIELQSKYLILFRENFKKFKSAKEKTIAVKIREGIVINKTNIDTYIDCVMEIINMYYVFLVNLYFDTFAYQRNGEEKYRYRYRDDSSRYVYVSTKCPDICRNIESSGDSIGHGEQCYLSSFVRSFEKFKLCLANLLKIDGTLKDKIGAVDAQLGNGIRSIQNFVRCLSSSSGLFNVIVFNNKNKKVLVSEKMVAFEKNNKDYAIDNLYLEHLYYTYYIVVQVLLGLYTNSLLKSELVFPKNKDALENYRGTICDLLSLGAPIAETKDGEEIPMVDIVDNFMIPAMPVRVEQEKIDVYIERIYGKKIDDLHFFVVEHFRGGGSFHDKLHFFVNVLKYILEDINVKRCRNSSEILKKIYSKLGIL